MPRPTNIEKLRKLAQGASRCVWMTREEAVRLTGSEGEGRYLEHVSPERILTLLDELADLRAQVAQKEQG